MKTSQIGIDLIKKFESLHDGDLSEIGLQPKMCPAGIWTEGYGHAMIDPLTGKFLEGYENELRAKELAFISNPDIDDEVEANTLLGIDLIVVETFLNETKLNLKQQQFDALISFIFNLGSGSFIKRNSTLRRLIDEDQNMVGKVLITDSHLIDYCGVAHIEVLRYNFLRWCKCKGKPLGGLILRRDEEYRLYNS